MDKLNDYFQYFIDNHDELFKEYPDKHIVIQDNKVVMDAPSFEKALDMALAAKMVPGTFLIQHCTEGEDGYTIDFRPRAKFLGI